MLFAVSPNLSTRSSACPGSSPGTSESAMRDSRRSSRLTRKSATRPGDARTIAVPKVLDLQPRLLQVELAFDAAHHVRADLACVAKPDQLLALCGVDLVHHPLVGEGSLLDPIRVLDLPRPHLEAPLAELVEGADSLDRPVAGPLLALQLVDPLQRRSGDHEPGAKLLVLLLARVPDHAQAAD